MLQEYLAIGQVLKPQGVRGEVRVKPLTDDPRRFLALGSIYLREGDDYLPRAARCTRVHDGFAYVEFDGVSSREEADALRGALLYVNRQHAVPLPEDTEFIVDLVGCEAYDTQGQPVGTLTDVLQPGASDVYVLDTPSGEMLFPALKRVVLSVDVKARRMVLDERALQEVCVHTDSK